MLAFNLKNADVKAILVDKRVLSLAAQCDKQDSLHTEIYHAYALFAERINAATAHQNKNARANALNAIRLSQSQLRLDTIREIEELDISHTKLIKTFGASAWASTQDRRRYMSKTKKLAFASAMLAAGLIMTRAHAFDLPLSLAALWVAQRMTQFQLTEKKDKDKFSKTFAVTARINKEIATRQLKLIIAESVAELFKNTLWPTSPKIGPIFKSLAEGTQNGAPQREPDSAKILYPSFPNG